MADDDSDGSDEWGMEELVIPATKELQHSEGKDANGDEDFWDKQDTPTIVAAAPSKEKPKPPPAVSTPMIIVDLTQIDANIHSKFDKNSVSDAAAASTLRKSIESDYNKYAKESPELLSDGTVIPCGSTVWRDALVRLREERPGHYFAPIFPPKES